MLHLNESNHLVRVIKLCFSAGYTTAIKLFKNYNNQMKSDPDGGCRHCLVY